VKTSSRRLKVIEWLSRRTRLDLEEERQELRQTLSSLESENAVHAQALKTVDTGMADLQRQLRPGQMLNLALYQSGTSHIEHSLHAVAAARDEVARIETRMFAERESVTRSQVRLQKLDEREQEEKNLISSIGRTHDQQQLDELWLLGRGRSEE